VTVDPCLAALADPTRRAIVQRLAHGRATVRQLAALNPAISRPAVSQHLRVLVDAGLVTPSSESRQSPYELVPERLILLEAWLSGLLDTWRAAPTNPHSHSQEGVRR